MKTAKNLLLKPLDYIFVTRPILCFPAWTVLFAGYIVSGSKHDLFWTLAQMQVAIGLLMGAAFIINQQVDLETDRLNGRYYLIAKDIVSVKAAWVETAVLTAAGLIIGFSIKFVLGAVLLAFFILIGIMYNYPPFKYKDRPIMGFASQTVMAFFAFLLGWLILRGWSWEMGVKALPYLFYNTAVCVNTVLPDIYGDRLTGKMTFGVKHGKYGAGLLALTIHLFSLVSAIWLNDYLIIVPSLIVAPLYVRQLIKKDVRAALFTVRVALFVLSLAVALYFPVYFIVVAFFYLLTRWYYNIRFEITYPSFTD